MARSALQMDLQNASDEDDTVSDNEDDESRISAHSPSRRTSSFKSLYQELQTERLARRAVEAEMVDLRASFSRLKSFTLEAVQQRDHVMFLKDEAESSQKGLLRKLNEALQCRDDAIRQRDEALRLKDDAIRSRDEVSLLKDVAMHARDSSRSDVESSIRFLVAGADRIAARASSIMRFADNLPRSSSHTGIAAVADGFTKRAEAIIDELFRQLDLASKDGAAMREQMEQRNYQSAIEVSELEASMQMLKEKLLTQSAELAKWQALAVENKQRLSEVEKMVLEKLSAAEKETHLLRSALHAKESQLQHVEASIKDLSRLLFKTHETVANQAVSFFPIEIVLDKVPPVSPAGEDPEEGIKHCKDRLEDIMKLFLNLAMTWKEQIDLRKKALEDLEGTVTRLIVEKKEITSFLEGALTIKQEMLEAVSKVSLESDENLNTITKKKEASNDGAGFIVGQSGSLNNDLVAGEVLNKGSVLELELKKSRQEIFELQQFLASTRGELELLRVTSEHQAKDVFDKAAKIEDLKSEQCLAQKTIEGLRTDLAATGDDLLKWKQALTKETEARTLLVEEVEQLKEQIAFLKQQARQLTDLLEDSSSKLCLKEEMAMAAVAARNAAERSLRIADERALQLRKKIDDLVKQLELLEGKDDGLTPVGWYDACWPYQWLRRRRLCPQTGAEMDKLLEPFV